MAEHKGGMFLLVFKGTAVRKLQSSTRKQDERITSGINRVSASSSKQSRFEEQKQDDKNETVGKISKQIKTEKLCMHVKHRINNILKFHLKL